MFTTRRAFQSLSILVLALFVSVAAPSRARAESGPAADVPEARRVLDRYAKATGGIDAILAERTLYRHATIEAFGFKGRLEQWSERPGRHYSSTEMGPFKLREGSDGVTSWRTDPTTGRVVRLSDRDSLEALESTWYEFERFLEPDFGGGAVTVEKHVRDSTGAFTVLTITAPGGTHPHHTWFSDATGLIARDESAHDQQTMVTTLDDWRIGAGRLRPWTMHAGLAGMPANRLETRADSFAVGVDVGRVPFTPPDSSGGNQLRWLGSGQRAGVSLPFDYRARHVWLKASINGGPLQDFLFDTGASVTVLDSTFAAKQGLKTSGQMQAAGAGASGTASFATLPSLSLAAPDGAGVELAELKVAVMSVNPMFARFFWGEMAGIIGYDFISRFVVTIDYDARTLVLHDPATYAHAGAGQPLPMKLNGVVPSVVATLDGRDTGEFRLDVGSSSTVDVHGPFAKAHGVAQRLQNSRPVMGAGFGGQFTSSLGRLKTMAIGPYAWKDPIVTVANTAEGAFASQDFAGNIGNRILERFKVTLDYEHRRLWLEPGLRYKDRDRFTRTGLLLAWSPDSVEAMSVLTGSPAEKAGLREGDRVTAVDGRPAASWKLTDLDELFENGADGRKVPVTVSRDGHERKLTMVLKEMLK
jgi:hypothetical protein